MPVHQQTSNGQSTKPFTPALSSRLGATKSPVTPKLAGSSQSSPTLAARPNIASIAREDVSPLSTNITPRSGDRRSRIGTDSPATPNSGTSAGRSRVSAKSKGTGEELAMNGAGLGISSPGVRPYTNARVLQNVNGNSAPSPIVTRRTSAGKSGIGNADLVAASPFFHADDAKSSNSSSGPPERPKLGPKAATFFHVGSGNATASPDPTRSNSFESSRPDSANFFHANDLPEPSPKIQARRPTLNKKSTASGGPPSLRSPDSPRKPKSPSRPASPLKDASYRSAPPALSSPPKTRPTATTVLTARIESARRLSVGSNVSTPRQQLHKKSSSTNVPNGATYKNSPPPQPIDASLSELQISPKAFKRYRLSRDMTSPVSGSPRSTSITSTTTVPTSISTAPVSSSEDVHVISPTLPPSQPPDTSKPPPTPAQEAATNARRERKVLDLEISNSSLLAINRTLEREMRKQNTELRRFRRLSRSGRLSIRTVSGQSKSSLGALAEEDSLDDSDAQNLLNGPDELDLGDSDDSSATDVDVDADSTLSSDLSSSHGLAQRKRDEKRLMLDLSKHRQLLIDSERMNSSIRRCLAWSEEMIKEGQKALDHQVTVGGRVLEHESDADEERAMGLVSPTRIVPTMEVEGLWADARVRNMAAE